MKKQIVNYMSLKISFIRFKQLLIVSMLLVSYTSIAQISTFPYVEDFEDGWGQWYYTWFDETTWSHGEPTGTIINSAATGNNAWVTNLSGNYSNEEDGWLQSPKFDLTSLSLPVIELSLWWNCENNYDGAVLQSSINNGQSWQNVGAVGSGINWFNNSQIISNPGGQSEGWSGQNASGNGSNGWLTASHDINHLIGETEVYFRFLFSSNSSVTDEGVAFDNFKIYDLSSVVLIPDPWFEQVLIDQGIDSDNAINGQVLEIDIYNVTELIIDTAINSFEGLQYFYNLRDFIYSGYYSSSLNSSIDFSGNQYLRKVVLDMSINGLNELDFTQNVALEELIIDIGTYNIQSIDLSYNTNLRVLELKDLYNFQNLDLTQNIALEELIIDVNAFSILSVDLTPNINLKSIDMAGFYSLLNLELPESLILEEVRLSGFYDLINLDVSENPYLKVLDLRLLESIQTLDIENLFELTELRLNSLPGLNDLDLTNQHYLNEFYLEGSHSITTLDLNNSTYLNTININSQFYPLRAINLKNGYNSLIASMVILGNNTCVLVDDVEYAENNFNWEITNSSYSDVLCITEPINGYVSAFNENTNLEIENWLNSNGNAQVYFYSGNITWNYYIDVIQNEFNNIIYETVFIATSGIGEEIVQGTLTLYTGNLAGEDFEPVEGDVANGVEEEGSLCEQESGTYDIGFFTQDSSGNLLDFNDDIYENTVIEYQQVDGPGVASVEGSIVDFPETGAGNFRYDYKLTVSKEVQYFGMSEPFTFVDEADIWHWLIIPFNPGENKEYTICIGEEITLMDLYNQFDIVNDVSGDDVADFNPDDYWFDNNGQQITAFQGAGVYTFNAEDFFPQCGGIPSTVTVVETSCGTPINLNVFLEGAYDTNTGLMRDSLRSTGVLPTTSPYTDALTCDASVFNVTGSDAIVDWIWLELRDSNNQETVIESRSALLKADGSIVDVDGFSTLVINPPTGNYYIMVSHRNHIGVLTFDSYTFNGTTLNIDLTTSNLMVQGADNAIANLGDGKFGIFAGDFNGDGQIQNTDRNIVIPLIGISGYSNADLNLNGEVQNNDINSILTPNIGKGEQFMSRNLFAPRRQN